MNDLRQVLHDALREHTPANVGDARVARILEDVWPVLERALPRPVTAVQCSRCHRSPLAFASLELEHDGKQVRTTVLWCPCGSTDDIAVSTRDVTEGDVVAIVCGPGGQSTVLRRG